MKPTFYNAVGIAELMMEEGYEIFRLELLHTDTEYALWQIVGKKINYPYLELYMNTSLPDWEAVKESLRRWREYHHG